MEPLVALLNLVGSVVALALLLRAAYLTGGGWRRLFVLTSVLCAIYVVGWLLLVFDIQESAVVMVLRTTAIVVWVTPWAAFGWYVPRVQAHARKHLQERACEVHQRIQRALPEGER